ncbi:MAG: class I tRNA ligase family protein [Candidatus Woesearchaeota archaeon]
MLEEIVANLQPTVTAAFITPNNRHIHIGNVRQELIEDILVRFQKLAGVDTFFPFGVHPTGFPTYNHVLAVLRDIAAGHMLWGEIGISANYGWDQRSLLDLVAKSPKLLLLARNALSDQPESYMAVHEAALPIVEDAAASIRKSIEQFHVDSTQFDATFLTTITPWYQRFTQWWIKQLDTKGLIAERERWLGWCSKCDSYKDPSGDMLECRSVQAADQDIIEEGDTARFRGPVYCSIHSDDLLGLRLWKGRVIQYDSQIISEGQQIGLAQLTDDLTKRLGTRIIPHNYRKSIASLLSSRRGKPLERPAHTNLGTPSPFDPRMVIEPLADSNYYFFGYVIAAAIKAGKIHEEQLTDEFFSFVMLQEEDLHRQALTAEKVVSTSGNLNPGTVQSIRREIQTRFSNWINIFGWDHYDAHGLYSLLNIAAVTPQLMPRAVLAYGMVTDASGRKMSKSIGNVVRPVDIVKIALQNVSNFSSGNRLNPDAVAADVARFYMLFEQNPENKMCLDTHQLTAATNKITEMYNLVVGQAKTVRGVKSIDKDGIDRWLESRITARVQHVYQLVGDFNFKLAAMEIFDGGGMISDYKKYIDMKRHSKQPLHPQTMLEYLRVIAQLASGFTPYLSAQLIRKIDHQHVGVECLMMDIAHAIRWTPGIRRVLDSVADRVEVGANPNLLAPELSELYERDILLEDTLRLTNGYASIDSIPAGGLKTMIREWEALAREIGTEVLKTDHGQSSEKAVFRIQLVVQTPLLVHALEKVNYTSIERLVGHTGKSGKRFLAIMTEADAPFSISVDPNIRQLYEVKIEYIQ